jgi:predicted lactoylglutathione lyase
MSSKVFINLAISDLPASMAFYTAIGFTNNPMFTDDTAAAMVFSDEIYVMLLTQKKFRDFIDKEIADTRKTASSIYALQMDSVAAVNDMAEKAVNAGAREYAEPKDYGFMQQRSFEDPDGHLWEVFYMDINKFPKQQ